MRWIRGMFDDDVEPLERWSVDNVEMEELSRGSAGDVERQTVRFQHFNVPTFQRQCVVR